MSCDTVRPMGEAIRTTRFGPSVTSIVLLR